MAEHYTDLNAKAIDGWVDAGWEWGTPLSHGDYLRAKAGEWQVVLTPQVPVPHSWFAPFLRDDRLEDAQILGLASGGGQQMPVFAALGAACTVLDYSEKQLAQERTVAAREGYAINIVRADMTKPLPFEDGSFDIIFHPVANCYVEDVDHVWRECFRLLRPGGVLLAGMDNGANFLLDESLPVPKVVHPLPYNPLRDPALMAECMAESGGSVQFSHSLTQQLGGQLQAGLVLTHLYEDRDREGGIQAFCPQYIATRAVKPPQ